MCYVQTALRRVAERSHGLRGSPLIVSSGLTTDANAQKALEPGQPGAGASSSNTAPDTKYEAEKFIITNIPAEATPDLIKFYMMAATPSAGSGVKVMSYPENSRALIVFTKPMGK